MDRRAAVKKLGGGDLEREHRNGDQHLERHGELPELGPEPGRNLRHLLRRHDTRPGDHDESHCDPHGWRVGDHLTGRSGAFTDGAVAADRPQCR